MKGEGLADQQGRVLREMLGYEAECKNFVIDPLYGPIALTETESNVLKTQLFQRLKNVKQLGFASSLYPGANHSRFEHSIGTLHTTWELFKRFISNSSSRNTWLKEFKTSSFNKDSTMQALRLSGLLHDIGHGPYSHTFETVFEDFKELKLLSHESLTLYMLSYGLDEKIKESRNKVIQGLKDIASKSANWREFQERRSELSRAITDSSLQRYVLMILSRDLEFQDFKPSERFLRIRYFLNELIASDVGADRIDYLLRDTYFTGLGHRFNLHQILDSIVGIFDTTKGILRIAIDADARNAVEFLLTTRYYHYRLIAHNPANLEQEFRFRCKLNPSLKKDPLRALKLATLDENETQKHMPHAVDECSRVFISDLRDIKVYPLRFFFYRIASDSVLKKRYLDVVTKNIFGKVKQQNPHSSLKTEDIHVGITLEKPHIPLLHVYREKYRMEKEDAVEYHSILLHDWSDIITALGRTYLLDSLFIVYASKRHATEVANAVSLSRKFYLSKALFRKFLRKNLQPTNFHRLEVLLSSLYEATKRGSQPVLTIQNLFDEVKKTQRRLSVHAYSMEHCYDAENETSFEYCEQLLNDLFIFAVSGIIGIEIKYMRSRKERRKPAWKAKYEITPVFGWVYSPTGSRRMRMSNLKRIRSYYPKNIRNLLFDKD
jgi:HD superfamily phosphohydrolase